MAGHYTLVNALAWPADTLHVEVLASAAVCTLAFSRPADVVWKDHIQGVHLYRLDAPLAAGDTARMNFGL